MDFSLVLDVLNDITGPVHKVTDLIAGGRPVHIILKLLLNLLSQHILQCDSTKCPNLHYTIVITNAVNEIPAVKLISTENLLPPV